MERDGLIVKLPYRGWFVREFTEQEVRELYEMRAALECFSVGSRANASRMEELTWLREHQSVGEAALKTADMEAYRIYNRDLHAAIMEAARNAYLSSGMGQLTLQSQMLMARTIRLAGRPSRAIEEHRDLIELIAKRKDNPPRRSWNVTSSARSTTSSGSASPGELTTEKPRAATPPSRAREADEASCGSDPSARRFN